MTNLLLVGGYTPPMGSGRGISLLAAGADGLTNRGLVALTESPSFLIGQQQIVYAVNEADQGRVTSFRWEGERLVQVCVQSTGGAHPCHLAVHPSGLLLAAANYTGGSFSLHRLEPGGGLSPASTVVALTGRGPDPDRQEAAHAHQVVFTDDGLYVVDLGSDRIWRYRLDVDAATVTAQQPLRLPSGFGPRQLVLDGDRVYVLGELSNELAVCSLAEPERPIAVLPAYGAPLPAGNLAAALVRSPAGDLVVSHRGADRICRFAADGDVPVLTCEFGSGGAGPRHVGADEGGFYVSDQLSDTVAWLAVDGTVRATAAVASPTCVVPLI